MIKELVLVYGGNLYVLNCREDELSWFSFILVIKSHLVCQHSSYSDWLPPVDVGEFLLSKSRKFLCLFVGVWVQSILFPLLLQQLGIKTFWL